MVVRLLDVIAIALQQIDRVRNGHHNEIQALGGALLLPGKLRMRVDPRVPQTGRDNIAMGVTSIDPEGKEGRSQKGEIIK